MQTTLASHINSNSNSKMPTKHVSSHPNQPSQPNTSSSPNMSDTTVTDRMSFIERIDVSACKYVASRTLVQFKDEFCTGNWKEQEGEKICNDVRAYKNEVQSFCKRMMRTDGQNKTTYKYAKNRSSGRIYTEQFAIQRLSKPLRDILVPADHVDYDMCNAHPTILLHVAKCNNLPHHYLEEYVTNREAILEKTNNTKRTILIFMNRDRNPVKNSDAWTDGFVAELKTIKAALYEQYKTKYPNTNKNNPVSSCVNKGLCDLENGLLQMAMQKYCKEDTTCVPMYDGFMTPVDIAVEELNEMTSVMGVTWKKKDWTKATVPESFIHASEERSLETMLERLQEKFFVVREPELTIWREGRNGPAPISRQSFMDESREYYYIDENGKEQQIANKWLALETKRAYDSITYQAHAAHDPPTIEEGVFNTARPFAFEYIEDKDERDPEALTMFRTLLEALTEDDDGMEYVQRYVAHMLQKPNERPQVVLLFKSHGGSGKDTLSVTISRMLGDFHTLVEDKMANLFGTFNKGLAHRLCVTMNEASGKEGAKYIEVLKNSMTAENIVIVAKGKDGYSQPNVFRALVFSNNPNPLPLDSGVTRRLFQSQVRADRQLPQSFFTKYYTNLEDKHWVDSLASDLYDIDLTQFNIREQPTTASLADKMKARISPMHKLLQDLAEGKHPEKVFEKVPKMPGCIAVKCSVFRDSYGEYLIDAFPCGTDPYLTEPKYFQNVCGNYSGIIYPDQRKYFDKKQTRVHIIHTERLLKGLKNRQEYTEPEEDEDEAMDSDDSYEEVFETSDEEDDDEPVKTTKTRCTAPLFRGSKSLQPATS